MKRDTKAITGVLSLYSLSMRVHTSPSQKCTIQYSPIHARPFTYRIPPISSCPISLTYHYAGDFFIPSSSHGYSTPPAPHRKPTDDPDQATTKTQQSNGGNLGLSARKQ